MGIFKGIRDIIKSNADKDGYSRHDRYTPDESAGKGKHHHDWTKSDRLTGRHQEGHTGSKVPRTRDKE